MATKRCFSLLIKPASADCNLRCDYCFYSSRSQLYPETSTHRMTDEVLTRMIASFMATDQPQHAFGWQGGEPTLMGVDFFRRVTELQQKFGRPGSVVVNGLQTNATLITDELASHLAKYHFLVGVSLDGTAELHDRFRTGVGRVGSHAAVLQGIGILKRHQVEFNALTLVNSANVGHGREVYQYLCDLGIYYHQYIPCVEFDRNGQVLPYSISGRQWGEFLGAVFDQWIASDTRKVSVRIFDAILNLMVAGEYQLCHMGGHCSQYFVVEHNGDVYPCDFFVDAEKKLGNIMENSWGQLLASEKYLTFGGQKAGWNSHCNECHYLLYCSGDCLKHRFYGGENPAQLSWLCEGWQSFFEHALPGFKKLAQEISIGQGHPAGNIPNISCGRNEPCFCGSGRKFKKCHGLSL